jgi:hypothetical protein
LAVLRRIAAIRIERRAAPDFDECLAGGEEADSARPGFEQDASQLLIAHIATTEPNDLRRRTMPIEEFREVVVLRHHGNRSGRRARRRENLGITGPMQPELFKVMGVGSVLFPQPSRQGRRKLRVDPGRGRGAGPLSSRDVGHESLRRENGMIELTGRVEQAGGNVVRFEIRIFREDLLRRLPRGEKLEHVDDADPNPANAGTSPTLLGINRDSGQEIGFAHLDTQERDALTWKNIATRASRPPVHGTPHALPNAKATPTTMPSSNLPVKLLPARQSNGAHFWLLARMANPANRIEAAISKSGLHTK